MGLVKAWLLKQKAICYNASKKIDITYNHSSFLFVQKTILDSLKIIRKVLKNVLKKTAIEFL
jgi:hypothetical protein